MALIGAHMSIAGGLWRSIERGEALQCEAIQIFTKNQLQWRAAPLRLSDCERFYQTWKRSQIRSVVGHASYLINLAGSDPVRCNSIQALVDEILRCEDLGIRDVVVHPGSHRGAGKEKGLKLLSEALSTILSETAETKVRILLETMSGQGDSLGDQIEDFVSVFDENTGDVRLGLCLDTCHLFAAGYELRTEEALFRLLSIVEKRVGLDRVGCVHLNDSLLERGSRRDRHTHIGQGRLGLVPFSLILASPHFAEVPCILETPKSGVGDAGNLALLRKLRGR